VLDGGQLTRRGAGEVVAEPCGLVTGEGVDEGFRAEEVLGAEAEAFAEAVGAFDANAHAATFESKRIKLASDIARSTTPIGTPTETVS
jgi:hypothetical protein